MKEIRDFIVTERLNPGDNYACLRLTAADGKELPEILPGQFVQVAVDKKGVFLRRPISICDVDYESSSITLLVRNAGKATKVLTEVAEGSTLNLILPLGNGFDTCLPESSRVLLIGGGVGVAPLLYLGRVLSGKGVATEYLLGARSTGDLLLTERFAEFGELHLCTEDGSAGTRGFVTAHDVLSQKFDRIYCCGPAPMMKAVAAKAKAAGCDCEVSLENMMACGLGACLCCVEKTVKGNVCVCTEGPVFNINQLTW